MVPISFPHRKPADSPALIPSRALSRPPQAEGEISSFRLGKVPTPLVLVVDDELLIRWSLNEGLARAGFQVVEAGDARSALEWFGAGMAPISAVVLDLRLPDSSDLGLLKRLRELAPDIPVIMMTAYGAAETRDEALQLGARQVVSKPFDVNRVVGLVAEALRG